jgi:hypothetical protein
MSSNSKSTVTAVVYTDDVETSRMTERKVIYTRKDGTRYVNFLDGTRDLRPGEDVYEIRYYTLKTVNIDDFMLSLKNK